MRSGDDPRTEMIIAALDQIADHADKTGVIYAVETTETTPDLLNAVLKRNACPYVRVAYDPAALLMEGDDPVAGVQPLADQVAISFARDALQGSGDRPGRETPFGTGHIDFAEYLAALEEAGYHGPQIIRRTNAENPIEEIAAAKKYLEDVLRG
jgi:sugar phosphate isomerase/epimerase